MKSICCQENEEIELNRYVSEAEPVVFSLKPFSGKVEFQVSSFEYLSSFLLGYHLDENVQRAAATPFYAKQLSDIPESYFLLSKSSSGYTSLFCLSHKDLIIRVQGRAGDKLILKAFSGESRFSSESRPAFLCVKGRDLYQTISITLRLALQIVGGKGKLAEEKPPLPSWLNSLGWESGASFGKEVTHDKVLSAVWSLRQLGVYPGFVLIDEGWQQVLSTSASNEPSLASFEADPHRFPYGIKGLVEELHRAGVHHVGVWHAFMGYCGGIHPLLAKSYNLSKDEKGRYFLGGDLGKTFQFYYDFYGYLRNQGIGFVKVGDQNSAFKFCKKEERTTDIFQNLQAAIQAAAGIQLDIPPFNAECLRNENLFYWATSKLASACDNLDNEDAVGGKIAIRNLLANSLWSQHLMTPDYSSWTSGLEQSEALGVLQALSCSVNIVSDPPGKHNELILKKIVLPSGKVIKPKAALTLCQDSVFQDPLSSNQLYKAFTYKGKCGVLAVFNLSEEKKTLHGILSLRDIHGIEGKRYAVFSHRNGFFKVLEKEEELSVSLKPEQCDIFTFSPIDAGVGIIGCYLFYLAPGPITEVTIEEESVHISSLVTGPMIMYSERQVLEIRRNGEVVPWQYDQEKKVLTFDSRSGLLELPAMYTVSFE